MTNQVQSYTHWQPLEEAVVGRVYPPDYFDFVKDAQVRNQLQQILFESEEDLNNLTKVMESHGVIVRLVWHLFFNCDSVRRSRIS